MSEIDTKGIIKFVKDWLRDTRRFIVKTLGIMFFAKDDNKYGLKDNKSSRQVTLIRLLFMIMIASFIVIVLRVSYLVTFKGEEYKRMVYSQRQTSDTVIPCERGSIYDSKGTLLASNIKQYIVILDAKQVNDMAKQKGSTSYIDATAQALNTYLGFDKDEILEFINNNPNDAYERISKDENGKVISLSQEELKPLMDAKLDNIGENAKISEFK